MLKILILGANGMLGNACVNYFSVNPEFEVMGTVRSEKCLPFFNSESKNKILVGINLLDKFDQQNLFETFSPDFVINCVGIVKQAKDATNVEQLILLNSLLPHMLVEQCRKFNAKLIHISTDCVFSGSKGSPYKEGDVSDATDLYGRTKYLGEIAHDPNVLTLRTSYIGNEFQGTNGLLEWFLSQQGECKGFTRAIYSGLPTVVLMGVIEDILIRHHDLSGLYQVASEPISKYNLLKLIAKVFNKNINVIPSDELIIDRSLDGSRFSEKTGFIAPSWEEMIEKMYLDRIANVQK